MAVELTDEEKKSPLYKYFQIKIESAPEELAFQIMEGTFDSENALMPTEMNRLFDEGYLPGEFGWYRLNDGGLMMANHTPMPGVTPEMFDWWFAWHGLESMRYKVWDKDDHYFCKTRNPEIALDTSLTMRQRYWNTTHDIKEALLDGQEPVDVCLTFVPPEVVGFDPEKLNEFNGTIVCTPGPAIMVHYVRPIEGGSELRTRFWLGYGTKESKPFRIPEFIPDENIAKAILLHNVKEFTHLAKILPDIYNEFKDKFSF